MKFMMKYDMVLLSYIDDLFFLATVVCACGMPSLNIRLDHESKNLRNLETRGPLLYGV